MTLSITHTSFALSGAAWPSKNKTLCHSNEASVLCVDSIERFCTSYNKYWLKSIELEFQTCWIWTVHRRPLYEDQNLELKVSNVDIRCRKLYQINLKREIQFCKIILWSQMFILHIINNVSIRIWNLSAVFIDPSTNRVQSNKNCNLLHTCDLIFICMQQHPSCSL